MFLGDSGRDIEMSQQDSCQSLAEKDLQDVLIQEPGTPSFKFSSEKEKKQPDMVRQENRYIIKPYLPPDAS